MTLEYLEDLDLEETQDLIPPWATPEVSPKNSCETTPLFIPPPKNFTPSINQDQVEVFCSPPQYSSACQHIPSFNNLPSVPMDIGV